MPLTHADGATGELRVGGRLAARLFGWGLRPEPTGGWAIRAGLREVNDLWLDSPGPFEVRLDVGRSVWRWRGVTPVREPFGIRITAHGEMEVL